MKKLLVAISLLLVVATVMAVPAFGAKSVDVDDLKWNVGQPIHKVEAAAEKAPKMDGAIAKNEYTYTYTYTEPLYMIDRVDFDNYVDWHEDHVLLKAAFPLDIIADNATYEIQFGHVQRPTHRNTSWDEAKFEVCAHKWADLSERDYGVSIINDCKYGYNIFWWQFV